MSNPLQNKLFHYEVQPPEGVWDKIATSLDEGISFTLSEKLYQYEEEPSPAVWQNISVQLDQSVAEKAKVLPLHIRYRRPLKYSGAVAIFIFLAVLTSLLISKKTESELSAEGAGHTTPAKKDTTPASAQSSKETESNAVFKSTEKNNSGPLAVKSKVARIRREESENSFFSIENFLPKEVQRNEMVASTVSTDKYMIYSDGDGNVIRLPKKIFSSFACPADNMDCKQHLQKLRERFAASAMTADFNGLLEILKSLQENQ